MLNNIGVPLTNGNIGYNSNLTVNGNISCSSLAVSGSYTATAYGNASYGTSSGNVGNILSSSVSGTASGNIGTLTLGVGVWMIFATVSLVKAGGSGYGYFISISTTSNTHNNNCELILIAGLSTTYLSITGAVGGGNLSTVVCNTSSTTYYLVLSGTNGAPDKYIGQYYAVRIA
jgi:hypothetical protein